MCCWGMLTPSNNNSILPTSTPSNKIKYPFESKKMTFFKVANVKENHPCVFS